jgi:MFS family permease
MPGALRFFLPAAVARSGVAMCGLSVLWAAQAGSGSFGRAGAATGAFAAADAVAGPQIARLVDRWGQRRVLSGTLVGFVAAGFALVLACRWAAAGPVTVGLAAAVGATVPPVGALSGARWRRVAPAEALPAALSLDGAVNDVAFLVGPALVTVLGAAVASWSGLMVAVALVAAGMLGLLTAGATEPPPGRPAGGFLVDRRLLTWRFARLFAVNLEMGFFFGGVGVTLTAFALAHHAGTLAGLIMTGSGVVSLTAGLAYGVFEKGRPTRVMLGASSTIAVGCVLLALVPGVPAMFFGYGLVGGCVALVLIPASVLLQRVTGRDVYTQAMTWMNSASAIGIAVAAPLIGHLVQGHGWPAGFRALAALTALVPLTLVRKRRRRRVGGPPGGDGVRADVS